MMTFIKDFFENIFTLFVTLRVILLNTFCKNIVDHCLGLTIGIGSNLSDFRGVNVGRPHIIPMVGE